MLAVLRNGGKQYLVKLGDTIRLEKINIKVGESIVFTEAFCFMNNQQHCKEDDSFVYKAQVKAEVIAQKKNKKIILFKKKRRKGYCRLNGHRQKSTFVKINTIERQ